MAVLLTWALFALWGTVGLALLKLGRFRWAVTTLLFAPTVGFAALAVPAYVLVRFEVPVGRSAVPVGVALFLLSVAVLWRARPAAARARRLWTRSRAFAAVLVGTFALTAWPLVGYGFDWVANGNDDMANYCMIATGYRDHGFAHVPTMADVHDGRDQTKSWFSYVVQEVRPGSEVLLALTSAWTGLAVQQVFMPVIVALNLALVAAAGGLVTATAGRRAGVLAALLLAVSAATAYGVVQQLIAQASGLALLCTGLALVSGRFRRVRARVLVGRAAVCGVVFAGQTMFYPEVIPLLVGGCVVLGLIDLARRRLDRRHLSHAGAAIALMAVLVPVYLYGSVYFLATQATQGGTAVHAEVFPFFLTPRGPAVTWGLLPLVGPQSAALQNACVIAGLVLMAGLAVPAVAGLRRRRPFAAVLAVLAAMTAVLFAQRGAFGLFKIAMFVQPFLWAAVAAWVVSRRSRWTARAAAAVLVVVVAQNARVQFWYVDQSVGKEGRVEMNAATTRRTLAAFRAEYARHTAAGDVDQVLLAGENVTFRKLMAVEVRGVPTGQLGMDPFEQTVRDLFSIGIVAPRVPPEWKQPLAALKEDYLERHRPGIGPSVRDPDTGAVLHRLVNAPAEQGARPPERVLVAAAVGPLSVFNRVRYPEAGASTVCARLSDVHNFAVFCDATGARQFFYGMKEPAAVGLHQMQTDPMFRKRSMAGVGRAVLVDVLNPAPRVRVLVEATGSYHTDPVWRAVPPVRVAGERRADFAAVGMGAVRLVSPPVAPQAVGAGRYLALDFGEARRNPNKLSAAEKLWGADLPRDRRHLTGHVRDISVLSEEEYAAFRPPRQIAKFPDDLTHPHLEYSGLFEEGWVGKEFKVRLTQPGPGHEAVIRAAIPQVGAAAGFRTEMTVLIDGALVEKRVLAPGEFEVRAPGGAAGPRWIELRFSHDQQMPAPDGRPVVALIRFAGFEPIDVSKSRPPEKLAAFPDDMSHPKLVRAGIATDGWCEKTCSATLWQAGPGRDAVVRGQIPVIDGNTGHLTELTLLLDGVEVATRRLGPGDFELRVPGGKTAQARTFECRFSNTQALPPPDGRSVGAHLQYVGFEPAAPAP